MCLFNTAQFWNVKSKNQSFLFWFSIEVITKLADFNNLHIQKLAQFFSLFVYIAWGNLNIFKNQCHQKGFQNFRSISLANISFSQRKCKYKLSLKNCSQIFDLFFKSYFFCKHFQKPIFAKFVLYFTSIYDRLFRDFKFREKFLFKKYVAEILNLEFNSQKRTTYSGIFIPKHALRFLHLHFYLRHYHREIVVWLLVKRNVKY